MRYIEPTMKITAFDAENIVTASNQTALEVIESFDKPNSSYATHAINVEKVMGYNLMN